MAVAFDGFSIREYTAKMRSVDVLKCWPFGKTGSGDFTREELESCLPPMTVPKSRWWSSDARSDPDVHRNPQNQPSEDEISSESVKSEKSEEKLDMICPVCRDFNAATLTAVNAHIDGCLAQTMREERRQMRLKSKSKVPKKRSIAEIFEEVEEEVVEQPQIQTVLNFLPFSKNNISNKADEVSITVTKFRWLSRQFGSKQWEGESSRKESKLVKSDDGIIISGREEEKLEMVCPVCRAFNAATVTAVNAHIDGCLAQAMREERRHMRIMNSNSNSKNPKPKAPKKRSIAEILTVAPPIEAKTSSELLVEIDDDEKSDDSGTVTAAAAVGTVISTIKSKKNTNKNIRKKKKMEKKLLMIKKKTVMTLNNEKKATTTTNKKKNKTKKKNLLRNGLNTANKEDYSKRKVQNPVNSSRKLKGTVGNKRVALDDINASAHKKKASLKYESVEKKQKAVHPIRGILKSHSTQIGGSTSSGCNTQDGTKETLCDVQELTSARPHVTFSVKDDIAGPKRRNSFDEISFSLSSDGQATSLVKAQSSESDEEDANLEGNQSKDYIAFDIDSRKEVCPVVESKQFSNTPEQVTVQNFLRPSTNLVEKSESLTEVALGDNNNLHLFDRGNTTTAQHCSDYTGIFRPLSTPQAGNICGINDQVGDSGAYSSAGNFIGHLGDSTYQVSSMNSDPNTRTFLRPSSLYSVSDNQANERSPFPSQTYGDNDNSVQGLGYRPPSHMFSADMMEDSSPFLSWGKGTIANNSVNENFFGLPLSSQGELINFSSSSGKEGVNQFQASRISRSSSDGVPLDNIAYQTNQGNLSISESLKDRVNQCPHYPARLGVTELQGGGRASINLPGTDRSFNHYARPLDSELNLMKYPFVEQNQHDQVQKQKRNGLISVKESSDHNSQSSSQPTMRLMGKDVPIGRSIKEVQVQQFEEGHVWADQQSRRNYSEDAPIENLLSKTCSKLDCVSGTPLQISSDNVTQSMRSQTNQALRSTLLMNGANSEFPQPFLDLQTNHVLQNGSQGFRKVSSSYSHPTITHPQASCGVFNRAPDDFPEQFKSGAKPVVQPSTCSYSQATCLSNGGLNERRKLPRATESAFEIPFVHPAAGEQAKTSWFQSSYRNMPPWLLSSTDAKPLETSSQQFSSPPSSRSYPYNIWGGNLTTPINYSAEAPYPLTSTASSVQPPLVPLRPAITIKPSSTVCSSGSGNKIKVADTDKKRPTGNLDESTKPVKLRNTEMTGLIQETSSSRAYQMSRRAVEFDDLAARSSKGCCLNEAKNKNINSVSCHRGFGSSNLDGMVISSPVRLSPGAKHILKPSPNVVNHEDNSRPIHRSAFSVAATNDSGRDLDIQRRMTKIYRF